MRTDNNILELAAGWSQADSRRAPRHSEAELTAVHNLLWGNSGDPARRAERIREFATTTGSAAVLVADVAAREMQALYQHTPRVMRQVLRVRTGIPSYNEVQAIRFDGAEGALPVVLEGAEYGQITISQAQSDTYRVAKFGALFEVSEEAIVNDPIAVFSSLPQRMVRGAIRTEEAFATSLFVDSGGWIDSFYTTQSGGAPSTLPLTVDNLKTAVGQMLSYTDSEGDPIVAMPKYLMVGPGLMIQAMSILNSISLNHTIDGSGSGAGTAVAQGQLNPLSQLGITLVVNPWFPVLATSGTIGSTMWGLFTDPNNLPAGEIGTLVGYDSPQISVPEESSTKRVQTDLMTWRIKTVLGGTRIDKRAVWGSFGQ